MYPKLANVPLVKDLANAMNAAEANARFAGLPRGSLRGTVTDVDDPEERGRVKVVFDDFNPDVPQVIGAGKWSQSRLGSSPVQSHWIDVSPAFKGKQPKGLVGKRVNINASNGEYQYAVLQDVVYDPETLVEEKGSEMEIPDNSSMTRLPVYESGSEPEACKENLGLCIVITGGYDDMDWMSVCLKRSGGYAWVNMMDRLHTHGSQENDSAGDREGKVNDDTHATT